METNFKTTTVKIKSIKVIPNEDVYDITVKDNHNFFANDILVHNCGEQILPVGGVCLLGSLNLTQFVNDERNGWDYKKLAEIIPTAVRMMDNVNDITYVPLAMQKEALVKKRRIGLGVLGYGSALMMMKIRYGSKEALKLTDELMSFVANTAYSASADLATEKGSFPDFDREKYLQSEFIKKLLPTTIEKISNGIRNSHLLSIQPTGNCLSISTKIKTREGVKSFKQLFDENLIDLSKNKQWFVPLKFTEVETLEGFKPITGFYVNGQSDTLKIQTESKNVEGKSEHKLLVKINDKQAIWKRFDELKVGDIVLCKNSTNKNDI